MKVYHELDLAQTAKRYQVAKQTIIDWTLAGFFPRPTFDEQGVPTWRAHSLDRHDLITWSNGGQPDPQKLYFYEVEAMGVMQ